MILTLTLNPTIDQVFLVEDFRLGETIRATGETRTPSGKGIGSSLVIHELGGETLALGFSAGHAGKLLSVLLDETGVRYQLLPATGETRIATILVNQHTGQQSTISAATLSASPQHLQQLLDQLHQHSSDAWGIICAGSLPPGLARDSYATIVERARKQNLWTLLDTSGEPLQQAIKGLPHILKINTDELRVLNPEIKVNVDSPSGIRKTFHKLQPFMGVWASDAIIITLGQSGTLAVTPPGHYYVHPIDVPVVSTAGAGDALSAGMMLALSRNNAWKQALAWGTAAAASVVMNAGTAICQRSQVETLIQQIMIEEIESYD